MTNKIINDSEQFACPKCNRNVTFKVKKKQIFVDEIKEPIKELIDKIADYGECKVAEEAKTPNHPIHSEFTECPFYEKLSSN